MSKIPPEKNFIAKNKLLSQNPNSTKLERLKKLQQQTTNLINHNMKLENHTEAENFLH